MESGIQIIDGLHVPYSIQEEFDGAVAYWGYGYETREEADRAMWASEAEGVTPPGIPVDMSTGKRESPVLVPRGPMHGE